MAELWFTVLGPVRVWRDGVEVDAGAPQQRSVLAVLLARAGQPVSLPELVDTLWGEDPPASAVNALQRSVGLLRRALEPGLSTRGEGRWLVRSGGGYRLAVDAETVDLLKFRALVAEARTAVAKVPLYAQALDLWQGPAASGIAAEVRERPVFTALDREFERVAVEAADAALAAGEPEPLVRGVERAAGLAPLDESLQARLIRLLAATGQQAAALQRFRTVRTRLADELGIDPGAELLAAHESVLRKPVEVTPKVAQLPVNPYGFTARDAELAEALAVTDDDGALIDTISGMAGVGKTTLAVHLAHRIAGQYPDGQLYVNLRGFGPSGKVADPADAVAGFLEALGVAPKQIPASLDARTALYRTRLAGRRMLVLLDNARDTAQVRPLLPGMPGCRVIVTSRDRLAGLIASYGARPISLEVFSPADSRQLLARRIGNPRIIAEPAAADEIVARCAGLPLALAVVAARAATQPRLPLAELAAELHDEGRRLDTLTTGDPDNDVRTVFSWSYHALTAGAARLFRLLGVHPGADVSAGAAASLAGLPPAQARRLLDELVRSGLLGEHVSGRYLLHDLLRAYAIDLADTEDAAAARIRDHYLHTALRATMLLAPSREAIELSTPAEGTTPEQPADQDDALAWFTAEYRVLEALLERLASTGFDLEAWELVWTLDTFQRRQGLLHDHVAAWRTALAAAQRLGDPRRLAGTFRDLGHALSRAQRPDEARAQFAHAIELSGDIGDPVGEGHLERGMAYTYVQDGRYDLALPHCLRALELYRSADHHSGLAKALNEAGYCHSQLGAFAAALDLCTQGLAIFRELGDRHGEAANLDSLGLVHGGLGDRDRAAECLGQAIDLYTLAGDRFEAATSQVNLGDLFASFGDTAAATLAWTSGLVTLRDLGHPNAARVQERIAAPTVDN